MNYSPFDRDPLPYETLLKQHEDVQPNFGTYKPDMKHKTLTSLDEDFSLKKSFDANASKTSYDNVVTKYQNATKQKYKINIDSI